MITPGPWRWIIDDYGHAILTNPADLVVVESPVRIREGGDMIPLAAGWMFDRIVDYLRDRVRQGDGNAGALYQMIDQTISANSPGSGKVGQ